MRLTAAAVKRLKAKANRRYVPDGRSLYLVIQPKSQSKSWVMIFRGAGGRIQKLRLGPLDETSHETSTEPVVGAPLTLAAARRLAAEVNRQRALGQDVVAQRLRDQAEMRAAQANTF